MKLDHSLIPNLKNLAPHWRQLDYDPGNVYSVMKDTGITGFTMRTDKIKADLRTWKDFFDFLPHREGPERELHREPVRGDRGRPELRSASR